MGWASEHPWREGGSLQPSSEAQLGVHVINAHIHVFVYTCPPPNTQGNLASCMSGGMGNTVIGAGSGGLWSSIVLELRCICLLRKGVRLLSGKIKRMNP